MKKRSGIYSLAYSILCLGLTSCLPSPQRIEHPVIPSLRYSENLKRTNPEAFPSQQITNAASNSRAQYRFAAGEGSPDAAIEPSYEVYHSSAPDIRDYNGPLSLGDPGVTASLWQESRGGSDLFRDYRAFQALDLITIVVTEVSEGKKEADTDSSTESSILSGITSFFGFEHDAIESNTSGKKTKRPGDDFTLDPSQLIKADSSNEFKGEAETTRKGSLKARISAMVVEVLPGGTMRIEGEKIIAVNNEEQVMVISGLVRPRDVNSNNEVDSSKIANLRIDYFGEGTVGDAQVGGWFGGMLRRLWPF